MGRGLRVQMAPIGSASTEGGVTGGRVSLERFGAGTTSGTRGAPVAASLEFKAFVFASARKPEKKEKSIGTLTGELLIDADSGTPLFSAAAGDNAALFEGKPPDPDARALRLDFSTNAFRVEPNKATIFVPSDLMEGAQHLELQVELKVAGAVEAGGTANDVLDVPLVPRPIFAVKVVDEIGEPLDGVALDIVAGSVTQSLATDAKGMFQVDDTGATSLTVTFSDAASVQKTLKTRWNAARPPGTLGATSAVKRVVVTELEEPLTLPGKRIQVVSIVPQVVRAKLLGMFFDTNKSFLLPSAMGDIASVKALYDANPESDLLVVGHTDTTGEPAVNDPISLERAESMAAFLKDDVDTWLGRYETRTPEKRRWGSIEDSRMLEALPDFFERPEDEAPLTWFQRTRNLQKGPAGPETRRALIKEYMAHDETTLPASITIQAHGCGEFSPLDDSETELDRTPDDDAADPVDRRVELFFFSREFGIQPPPPGKNSKKDAPEYPEWRRRSKLAHDASLIFSDRVLRVRLQVDGEPASNEEYSFDVDDRRLAVARTGEDGLVEQRLPVGAKLAVIRIPRLDIQRSLQLEPAETFPSVEKFIGAQVRLAQLGFLTGEASGKLDGPTRQAIRAFKVRAGLAADEVLDGPTKEKLKEAYGS